MRTPRLMLTILTVIFALSLALVPTLTAQDETITCSSDLVVMLYVAERYFGFGAFHNNMMLTTDVATMVDLSRIDRGQYQPLFDNMMMMAGDDMMTDDAMMDATMMADVSAMMAMSDADMMMRMSGGADMTGTTPLIPAIVATEPAECVMLRIELTEFFSAVATRDMEMGMMGGMVVTVVPDITAEPISEATEAVMEMTAEATAEVEMVATSFSAPLSGPQEAPGPGDADATGTAAIDLNLAMNQLCWNISVQNAALPAIAANIHMGAEGEPGPIVASLSAPNIAGAANGCATVDPSVISGIINNPTNHYVSITTQGFEAGALRGQLVGTGQ